MGSEKDLAGISVIVCCYNSASRLEETLQYLLRQEGTISFPWEIIVVNNASQDSTTAVATKALNGNFFKIPFKVVDQPVAGLSYARDKGVEESSFSTVIFCDDDNHLEKGYVRNAHELISTHSEVGILGGLAKPKLPFFPGSWIVDFYPALAIGPQAARDGYVDWVYGAGMVLRKKIFAELNQRGIDLMLTDRKGTKQTSGGDAEMCLAARFLGYRIFYSSKLILEHAIDEQRLSRKSFVRANYRNVFPMVYLYLMTQVMKTRDARRTKLFYHFLWERIKMIFHFLPRTFLGNHRFYSFIMLYQNKQLLLWLLMRRRLFNETHGSIKQNLNQNNPSDGL